MSLVAAIASRNPALSQHLLSTSQGRPGAALPPQQLYDSIDATRSDHYYTSVGDGSFTSGSAHYSEVSYADDANHRTPQPAPGGAPKRSLKTFPPNSHVLPHGRPTASVHADGSQIYANVSIEVADAFQRGLYECDEAHTLDSRHPSSTSRNLLNASVATEQYSYACVGKPEVCFMVYPCR